MGDRRLARNTRGPNIRLTRAVQLLHGLRPLIWIFSQALISMSMW
jgi:hypothetical protein